MIKNAILLLLIWASFSVAQDKHLTEIKVETIVGDTSWHVRIDEVYVVKRELWVISHLGQEGCCGECVIGPVSDTIWLDTEKLPIKHFVISEKPQCSSDNEGLNFIRDRNVISDELIGIEPIYKREKRPKINLGHGMQLRPAGTANQH